MNTPPSGPSPAMIRGLVLRLLHQQGLELQALRLRPPQRPARVDLLPLTDGRLGQWDGLSRSITLDLHWAFRASWADLVLVLRHELAHMLAEEHLGGRGEKPHGEHFRQACALFGIDHHARVQVTTAGQQSGLCVRIAKLLALAQSANEHEAQSAAAKAQELALRHNIDLLQATGAAAPDYTVRPLGEPLTRLLASWNILAGILRDHFFVESFWMSHPVEGQQRSHWQLEIYGTVENLDMAEYVYHFLLASGQHLWQEHRSGQQAVKGARQAQFLAGLYTGFRDKLEAARSQLETRHALVWHRDQRLRGFFEELNPRRRTSYSRVNAGHGTFQSGLAAGASLNLHKPLAQKNSGAPRGLLH